MRTLRARWRQQMHSISIPKSQLKSVAFKNPLPRSKVILYLAWMFKECRRWMELFLFLQDEGGSDEGWGKE